MPARRFVHFAPRRPIHCAGLRRAAAAVAGIGLALGAAAAGAAAQVGLRVESPPLREFGNTEAHDFEDFMHRAVLLVFIDIDIESNALVVPHLNLLIDTYGDRGLSVLAVLERRPDEAPQWIEERGANFAYAYERGDELTRFAHARTFPRALVLDPTGEVMWAGHAGQLDAEAVAPHVEGGLPRPLFEYPREADRVVKELRRGELGAALEEAQALAADHPELGAELVEGVRGLVRLRVERLRAARQRGDYLEVLDDGDDVARMLAGLPEVDGVEALVDAVEDDADARDVAAAQRTVERLRARIVKLDKKRDADALLEKLARLRDEHPDDHAGIDAKVALAELEGLRVDLR